MRNKQGAQLEAALKDILNSSGKKFPKGSKRLVSLNEHFNVDGIQFEIDVVTRTTTPDEIEVLELYECKDWKAKVGPKEISWLREKVELLKAKHGYLVASESTKSTTAYCAKFPSVSFRKLSKDKLVSTNAEVRIVAQTAAWEPVNVTAIWEDESQTNPKNFDATNCDFRLSGRKTDLINYVEDSLEEEARELIKREKARLTLYGVHPIPTHFDVTEVGKTMSLDGYRVKALRIKTTLVYEPSECRIEQIWDIEKEGWKTVFSPDYQTCKDDVKIEVFGSNPK